MEDFKDRVVVITGTGIGFSFAVLAITESLREEVPEFIEVGLICPGS